jgi:hypothetical protein
MAEDCTFAELRDMHYLYGVAEGNARKAERLYRERFPTRKHPSSKMFVSIQHRLGETGSLRPQNHAGCSRYARTVDTEEAVLHCIKKQPSTSTRAIAKVEAPTFSDIRLIDGGKVVSPTRRLLFTPRKIPVTHFC